MRQLHRQEAYMKDHKQDKYIFFVLLIPVIWFAILIAPYTEGGLIYALPYLSEAINHPFSIVWCSKTFKIIFVFILIYAVCVTVYLSTAKNYQIGRAHV